MTPVFADTFYFLAIINPKDGAHRAAVDFSRLRREPVLTTEWVLIELADGLARTPNRHLFQQIQHDLRDSFDDVVVPCSQELFDAGVQLYNARPDKEWSLTDCISFAVMEQHGVTEALTGDHHFEQAGFVALLR